MKSRIVLITGAAHGIGFDMAQRFANKHYQVVGIDLKESSQPFPGKLFLTNLADVSATQSCMEDILRQYPVDVIINNVGRSVSQKLTELNLLEFNQIMDLNVRSAVQIAKLCVPGMLSRSFGRIINIASIRAVGGTNTTSYGASKAALVGCTLNWAVELAQTGVTVNCVAPGAIDTEMLRKDYPVGSDAERLFLQHIPMRRIGKPIEISSAVEFFASDEAGYITGQVLFVDGGITLVPA